MPSETIGNGPVGAKLWVPTGRLRYPQNLSKPGKFMIGRSESLKKYYATKVGILLAKSMKNSYQVESSQTKLWLRSYAGEKVTSTHETVPNRTKKRHNETFKRNFSTKIGRQGREVILTLGQEKIFERLRCW